jgi:hypothetical protein
MRRFAPPLRARVFFIGSPLATDKRCSADTGEAMTRRAP